MESDSNLSVQDVGAVIVNWNAGAYLENCLRSFLLEGVLVRNIVVVDHGSSDDSVGIVRQHFPEVRVIIDTRNPGYSTAINHGTRHLSTPVFVVSNPDIVVQEGALSEILRSFQSDGTVALAGCKLVDQYGNDATRFSRTSVTRAVLLLIVPSNFRGYWRAHEQRVHNWKQPFEVSYVEGAFMVIRRTVFDAVGGFDEDFSFFFEDADFPLRLRKSGWKVVHIPGASVTHLGNASFSKVPVRRTVEFYKNILLLYEKHSYRRFLWLRRILFLIVKTKLSLFSILRLGSLRLVAQKIEINRELLQVFHQYRVERNSRAKEELPIHDGQNEDRGPLVSVIIPTYNRVDCLLQLLDVLKRQTYQNFEVLVVDQSDMVDEAKERSYRSFGSKLKVLHSHTRGRSLAKNLGIGKARGDLLLFCDDDVIPGVLQNRPEGTSGSAIETDLADYRIW
jgi:GT2 family glycosyltransferase